MALAEAPLIRYEERESELSFGTLQALGDRRLRDTEGRCSAPDLAMRRHREEVVDVVEANTHWRTFSKHGAFDDDSIELSPDR